MQTTLIVAYRRLRKHPTKLKVRRRWLYQEGTDQRLVIYGLWGKDGFGEGFGLQKLTIYKLRGGSKQKCLFILGLLPTEINSRYMTCWSLLLDLSVNRPAPPEGRRLIGKLQIRPHLLSCASKVLPIKWEEPFHTKLYGGVDMNPQGHFIIPGTVPQEYLRGLISSCDTSDTENRNSFRRSIENIVSWITAEQLDTSSFSEYLAGGATLHLLEHPQVQLLRWNREHYLREWDAGRSTAEVASEIVAALRVEYSFIEAHMKVIVRPLLESPTTVNKQLADPLLRFEEQLTTLLTNGVGEQFHHTFMELECLPWTKVVMWIVIQNLDFFKAHLQSVLDSTEPEVQELLTRSRNIPIKMNPTFSRMVYQNFEDLIGSKTRQASNYLYKAEESFSKMVGHTKLANIDSIAFIFEDICISVEEKTLVMWKTTTAEDRARGKIYLRGFTKVDPVEDRLEV